ncbi:hypothetical protein ACC702_03725 [Rhizobium ruizarguesonis]
MNYPHALGLEPIGPAQRMIGLILTLDGVSGKPVFTYESLAYRVLEEAEKPRFEKDVKALGEQFRRIHRGEISQTRAVPALYTVFADEITDELVDGWYVAAADSLERHYLLGDNDGVWHDARQIQSSRHRRDFSADTAHFWLLQGRVRQLLGYDLDFAFKAFTRAADAFSELMSRDDTNAYMRYQHLLSMEAQLNVQYRVRKLSAQGDAKYQILVHDLLSRGLTEELRWALEVIAPSSRRALFLAEAFAPVDRSAAAAAFRQAILINPYLAHFDLAPFPNEEPILKSEFLGPVARAMEHTDVALLQASRTLAPRAAVSELERVKLSRQLREIYDQITISFDANKEESNHE